MRIPKKCHPEDYETLLERFSPEDGSPCDLYVPSQFGPSILGDPWAAIITGTACRLAQNVRTITWGVKEWSDDLPFCSTLPGIAGIQLSTKTLTDNGIEVATAREEVQRRIGYMRDGLVKGQSGNSRTLIEFPPELSDSHLISGRTKEDRLLCFSELISNFRRDVDNSYRVRGYNPAAPSGSLKKTINWLFELHSNARSYGSIFRREGLLQPSLRMMRIKGHLAISRQDLLSRSHPDSVIHEYLRTITQTLGEKTQGIVEASVSDFGPGVIDHFLNSDNGAPFRDAERRQLLQDLVLKKMSSSSNLAAGEGMKNALTAAQELGAFISLRTDRYWVTQNFAHPESPLELRDVGSGNFSKVAGTHWQLLMPMAMP